MNIKVNDIVTFGNDEKFLVLSSCDYEGSKYHYLVEVINDEEDVNDNIMVAKEELEDGKMFLVPLEESEELKNVSLLLANALDENEEIAE